jgi:hypothetical protein
MDIPVTPGFVQTYQTLFGSLIAFVGVSCTLVWNANAARKLERFKSEQQRIALLAAIRAELTVFQSALQLPLHQLFSSVGSSSTPEPEARFDYPALPPRIVFERNVDKIGLLGVSVSAIVVVAYSEIARFEAVVGPGSRGNGIDEDEAMSSAARAFTATGQAIQRVKESLPKEEQRELIMFPQPEVSQKDVEWFLERRHDLSSRRSVRPANDGTVTTP